MNKIKFLILAGFSMLIISCSSISTYSYKPTDSDSVLIIYRDENDEQAGELSEVSVDSQSIAKLWPGQYFQLNVKPGKHSVSVSMVGRVADAKSIEVTTKPQSKSLLSIQAESVGIIGGLVPISRLFKNPFYITEKDMSDIKSANLEKEYEIKIKYIH